MKKYQIIWVNKSGTIKEIFGAAGSKAPADVMAIAKKCGYESKYVYSFQKGVKLFSVLMNFYYLIKTLKRCQKESVILLQYPCFNEKLFQFAIYLFPKRNYITIIHDINSIRLKGGISKTEISCLSLFNKIIVHSLEMKYYLSRYLPSSIEYQIIDCFPYLTDSVCKETEVLNEVCYAGNIDKAIFLNKFIANLDKIKLKLYGKMEKELSYSSNVKYCGMFNPNDISSLSGSWGLVWDGDSVETCAGTWGEYLKIIAPHKFSLYIAAGIPVIVWEKSAIARMVREQGIGITVFSLNELETKLDSISSIQYKEMLKSVKILQGKIRKGGNLINFL